jgi:hypothetical protein
MLISTLFNTDFNHILISTFHILTYFNVILTPGFTNDGGSRGELQPADSRPLGCTSDQQCLAPNGTSGWLWCTNGQACPRPLQWRYAIKVSRDTVPPNTEEVAIEIINDTQAAIPSLSPILLSDEYHTKKKGF